MLTKRPKEAARSWVARRAATAKRDGMLIRRVFVIYRHLLDRSSFISFNKFSRASTGGCFDG